MREYKLADTDYRLTVDLRGYEDEIKEIVKEYAPDVEVSVFEDKYVLNKQIEPGQAIRIGKALAKSALGKYSLLRPILFVGQDTIKTKNKGGKKANGSTTSGNTKLGGRPKKTPTRGHQ